MRLTAVPVDQMRPATTPIDHLEERFRLPAEFRHPGLGVKLYERACAWLPVTYPLDLLGKIVDRLTPTPARGDERIRLGAHRIDEIDEARVLPRVFGLPIGAGLPGPAAFGVAEFVPIRQFLSRL